MKNYHLKKNTNLIMPGKPIHQLRILVKLPLLCCLDGIGIDTVGIDTVGIDTVGIDTVGKNITKYG